MDLSGLFDKFITALASVFGTFLAIRCGSWVFEGRKPGKKSEDKKEDGEK
jgi:hypothetical protein